MKKRVMFLNWIFLLASCGNVEKETTKQASNNPKPMGTPIIAIKDIAGKTEKEVAQILGKGGKPEKVRPSKTPCPEKGCDKIEYQAGKYSIVYMNNKADWITINNVSEHALDETAITLLGIEPRKASFKNPSMVIRWEQIEGMNEISFFNNGSDKIDYIYVKTFTK